MFSVNAHIFVLKLLPATNGFGECDYYHSLGGISLAEGTGVQLNSAFRSDINLVYDPPVSTMEGRGASTMMSTLPVMFRIYLLLGGRFRLEFV